MKALAATPVPVAYHQLWRRQKFGKNVNLLLFLNQVGQSYILFLNFDLPYSVLSLHYCPRFTSFAMPLPEDTTLIPPINISLHVVHPIAVVCIRTSSDISIRPIVNTAVNTALPFFSVLSLILSSPSPAFNSLFSYFINHKRCQPLPKYPDTTQKAFYQLLLKPISSLLSPFQNLEQFPRHPSAPRTRDQVCQRPFPLRHSWLNS